MFCAEKKTYLQILANLQSNKRQKKKRYDFPINISPTCISLNANFSIPTKTLESCSHFLASLIDYLVQRAISDRLEPELRFIKINVITVN